LKIALTPSERFSCVPLSDSQELRSSVFFSHDKTEGMSADIIEDSMVFHNVDEANLVSATIVANWLN
jgi:hypothetical protein